VIWVATQQWFKARKRVIFFRERGYQWSMTHSYFAENGGFVYCDIEGNMRVIEAIEFLRLCLAGKIDHPLITEDEIMDKSKSDTVAKAIFTIQLLWFVLQVAVRHSVGLVVTLVELDTLCMAVLAVFYLLLWWSKPLSVRCPHIFYESIETNVYSREELSKAWKPQPSFLRRLWYGKKAKSINDGENILQAATEGCFLIRKLKAALNKGVQDTGYVNPPYVAMLIAWTVLGALHLTAWNYEFPTETERIIWRAAALGLTGSVLVAVIVVILVLSETAKHDSVTTGYYALSFLGVFSAVVCRVMLAVLMFLSLRTLPCSAHQIISWVQYIPHL